MKKPRFILMLTFALLIVCRIMFADIKNLNTFVGMINIVAAFIVFFDINYRIQKKVLKKISNTCCSQTIANREKSKFLRLNYTGAVIFTILFVSGYLFFLCSSTANDILAIVGLGMSVLDEEIIAVSSELYRI